MPELMRMPFRDAGPLAGAQDRPAVAADGVGFPWDTPRTGFAPAALAGLNTRLALAPQRGMVLGNRFPRAEHIGLRIILEEARQHLLSFGAQVDLRRMPTMGGLVGARAEHPDLARTIDVFDPHADNLTGARAGQTL